VEAFFISTGIILLAEIGDKTQLLAFLLAARFKKPIPIILGILLATVLNHALAGALGALISSALNAELLRWILGVTFIGMAIWIVIPDKLDAEQFTLVKKWGIFGTTLVTFFLAEMGDKTQIATVILATHYASALSVVLGTTLGMMLANVPAVYAGEKVTQRISMKLVHAIAAGIFMFFGFATLFGVGENFGF